MNLSEYEANHGRMYVVLSRTEYLARLELSRLIKLGLIVKIIMQRLWFVDYTKQS